MKQKITKIALINPRKQLQEQNPRIYNMFERNKNTLRRWYGPSLSLLIIASLTPKHIDVKIFDEYIEDIDFNEEFDLVGITAMTQQAQRAYEIAAIYKLKNIPVVMGGIHATVAPDEALKHVDVIFRGESENLWSQFIHDFENGKPGQIYQDKTPFNLANSTLPKYDLINYSKFKSIDNYFKYIPVQATRGCPHDCCFCIVSKFYGKKIRKKPVEKVVEEIKQLQNLNYDSLLLFVDDNLFVDRKYAKELMRALIPLKIKYVAQTDVKLADDPELLELVYKSGCVMVVIGFESIDAGSLEGINENNWKFKQRQNYENAIRIIQGNGIIVYGAFVVGFDNDTPATFENVRNFVLKNNIFGQFTLLTPLPGSKIYDEMKSAGRLLNETFWDSSSFWNLTIKHNHLEKEVAEDKLVWLHEQVYSEENVQNLNLHLMQIYKKLPPRWVI